MGIRYDQKLNEDIRRVVSNFNAKIARLEKQGKELIPDRVYVSQLKAEYDKRYELKRKLKELQRFSRRGVEEVIKTEGGVKTTKYALDNLKRDIRRSNYRLSREITRLERKITPLDITRRGALNLARSRKDLLSRNIAKLNKRQLESIKANVNRVLDYDKRTEQFQANFFQVIFSEAAYSGVSQDILDSIQNTLAGLTAEQLLQLSKENPHIKALLDYSPTEGTYVSEQRMRDILTTIEAELPMILQEFNE